MGRDHNDTRVDASRDLRSAPTATTSDWRHLACRGNPDPPWSAIHGTPKEDRGRPWPLPGFPLASEAPSVDLKESALLLEKHACTARPAVESSPHIPYQVARNPKHDARLAVPVEAHPMATISNPVRQHSCGRRERERTALRTPSNCSNHPLIRRIIARCRKNDWRRCERLHRSHRSTSNPG